jgi:hypothetical protein
MIERIKIENFKNFEHFEFEGFKRVNLIAGKNNVGKTNLLEAIFNAHNNFGPIGLIFFYCQRNYLPISKDGTSFDPVYGNQLLGESIKTIFYKEGFPIKLIIQIGTTTASYLNFERRFLNTNTGQEVQLIPTDSFDPKNILVDFQVKTNDKVYYDRFKGYPFNPADYMGKNGGVFISYSDAEVSNYQIYYDKMLLDGKRELFFNLTYKILGIEIHDFRSIKNSETGIINYWLQINGGKYVLLGDLGYGTNRLIKIILIFLNNPNDLILIDEVDLGVHYSIQQKFWESIFKVSKELNVQIFATTHSRDCFEAFAKVANEFEGEGKFIRLQEFKGKIEAVDYDEKAMMGAYESDYEVR